METAVIAAGDAISDATNPKPDSLERGPGFEVRFHRARSAAIFAIVFYTGFTVSQSVAFERFGGVGILDAGAASVSIFINVLAVLGQITFYLANYVVGPLLRWDRERLFRVTAHAVSAWMILLSVGHVHIAGSGNTTLPILFVSMCIVVAWILGPRAAWGYFAMGMVCWAALFPLEKIGLLTYLPLHQQHARVPLDIFLEPRYLGMAFALFLANGVFILAMTTFFQRQEEKANAELDRRNRQLEESNNQLRELERLRDNLTHMIVHDLRAPLAGIQLNLQSYRRRLSEDQPGFERVDKTLAGIRYLLEIINSLLDVGRFESGRLEVVRRDTDAGAAVRDAVAALGALTEGRTIRVEMDGSPAPPFDGDLIRRVFSNLIGNALKFTDRGCEIRVGCVREGETPRFFVRDFGPGIPKEDQGKIFEKFGQADLRGDRRVHSTGLGLTFCRLAVEAHGGRIGVDSTVGEGSTFWFTIPPEDAPA